MRFPKASFLALTAWLGSGLAASGVPVTELLAQATPAEGTQPMDQLELLDFMEKVVHAQAVDTACDVFDKDRKGQLYLAYRWGQSQAMSGTYPPQLMLTIIQAKAQYHTDTKDLNCASEEVGRVAQSLAQFVDATRDQVNLSDIR